MFVVVCLYASPLFMVGRHCFPLNDCLSQNYVHSLTLQDMFTTRHLYNNQDQTTFALILSAYIAFEICLALK